MTRRTVAAFLVIAGLSGAPAIRVQAQPTGALAEQLKSGAPQSHPGALYRKYEKDPRMLDAFLKGVEEGYAVGIRGKPHHLLAPSALKDASARAKQEGFIFGYEEGHATRRRLSAAER